MDRDFSSFGLGRGTLRPSGDWDARVGGNDQEGLGSTPGGRSPREVPPSGSVRFAPGVCSTPMPQGEGAPDNVTRYGGGDMSLTRGADFDGSGETPGFQQFYSLLRERQTILEGVVDRIQGEMGQIRGNITQVQGDLGAVNSRVDSLGQDVGALRGDIGSLEANVTSQMGTLRTDVTSQMGSMETNMGTQLGEITQMLAGMLRSDKPQSATKPQQVKVTVSQPVGTSSQGSPWVPSSVPEQSLPFEQPVASVRSPRSVSDHNPEVTSVSAAQGQPLSSMGYSSLGSGLPSTIAHGSFLSGNTLSGGYPIHPSMGQPVPGHFAGGMGMPVTAPTASVYSSAANLGCQSSGYHGGLVEQSAALGGGQSFAPGIGGWSCVPQGHTLMTTADASQFPSLIPPGTRNSMSRNIPAEVKWMKYNGDVEWGPFYSKFSTIAEYHQWSDPDRLFALSLTLEGAALKYFDILRRRGAMLSFREVVLRMEERFGKSSLRAASQLEFSSIAQKPEETIEQWADRVMDTAQKAFGSGTSPEIFQEQLIVRFALGCSDGEAGQQLINNPPCTLAEAIKRVKTYQLSRQAVVRRPRAVRSVSSERDSEGRRDSRSPPAHRRKLSDYECRDKSEERKTSSPRDSRESSRGRSPTHSPMRGKSASSGRSKSSGSVVCYDCKEPGHIRRNCPRRSNPESLCSCLKKSDEITSRRRSSNSANRVTFSDTPNIKATYIIPSIRSGSQGLSAGAWRIPLTIGGQQVKATIDTAADITIISGQVYRSLRPQPEVVKDTNVRLAGEGAGMTAQYLGSLNLRIGDYDFVHPTYVGPLQDEMLLGIDFLRAHGAEVSCEAGTLKVKGIDKAFELSTEASVPVLDAVSARRVRVPPHTAQVIECDLSADMPEFILEPTSIFPPGIVASRTYNAAGNKGKLCILNLTDRSHIIKTGTKVGEATPAVSVESTDPTVRRMSVGGENSHQHIAPLLEQLGKSAPVEVESQAVELVKEFADVFAVNDLDLGNFSEIKHRIDTGDALPVKQRMRRTPAVFQGEEEGHLDKMLEAGVIQPSSSDWASAPVLVRKKDGNVRWCVDYRALNKVTVKDTYPLPLIEECMDTLAGNRWFSKLDANAAYWQIKLAPEENSLHYEVWAV